VIHEICMHPWQFAVAPFRIAGTIYYVGNRNVSSHLIDTGDGLILVDTAFPQSAYLLLESIRRLGFNPDDIKCILHSHGHYDHFGGTRAIVELTGARTFLGENDIEILEELPELSWAPEYGVRFHETFAVDHALRDGEVISLGNTSIQCVHIPGHTPGSMAYFFETVDRGRIYRVGIHGGPGLNTLTDVYLLDYGLPTSRRVDYMTSLRRLQEERVDIQLGAHPAQNDTLGKRARMAEQRNPFIDGAAWSRFLEDLETRAREAFGPA
jgi:metallo-beta-lactamase class B